MVGYISIKNMKNIICTSNNNKNSKCNNTINKKKNNDNNGHFSFVNNFIFQTNFLF